MKKLPKKFQDYEVSKDSMRSGHIIERCVSFLREVNHPLDAEIEKEVQKQINDFINEILENESPDTISLEDLICVFERKTSESIKTNLDVFKEELDVYLNENVFEKMNEIAPENTYFGSHPGNGSSFGFWVIDPYINYCEKQNITYANPDDFEDYFSGFHFAFPISNCLSTHILVVAENEESALERLGQWAQENNSHILEDSTEGIPEDAIYAGDVYIEYPAFIREINL
jgi:hypothetical protein